jgi:hypothetical protein
MRVILASILLAMGLLITGCYTVCDDRGPSKTCEIHHVEMHAKVVTNHGPTFPPTKEYFGARPALFAHTYPVILPDQCKRYIVYLCDDCVRAEQEWKKQHAATK